MYLNRDTALPSPGDAPGAVELYWSQSILPIGLEGGVFTILKVSKHQLQASVAQKIQFAPQGYLRRHPQE